MDVHFPNSCICMDVYFPNLRAFDLVEDLAYVIDLEFLFICVGYDSIIWSFHCVSQFLNVCFMCMYLCMYV